MIALPRWLALAALALLCLAVPAAAQTFPALSGRVVDAANLLDAAQEADLTAKLAARESATGRQMVVATVTGLQDQPIEVSGLGLCLP